MTDNPKKILIIEDDPKSLKLEKDLLEVRGGYKIFSTADAENGLILIREYVPDLIISDYQLPGLSGLELHAILKKDKTTRDIPVVFVTASVTVEEKEKLTSTGCPVIEKPINTRTFVAKIGAYLK